MFGKKRETPKKPHVLEETHQNLMNQISVWEKELPTNLRLIITSGEDAPGRHFFDNYVKIQDLYVRHWTTAGRFVLVAKTEETTIFINSREGDVNTLDAHFYTAERLYSARDIRHIDIYLPEQGEKPLPHEVILESLNDLTVNSIVTMEITETADSKTRFSVGAHWNTYPNGHGGELTTKGTYLGHTHDNEGTHEYVFSQGTLTVKPYGQEPHTSALTWQTSDGAKRKFVSVSDFDIIIHD